MGVLLALVIGAAAIWLQRQADLSQARIAQAQSVLNADNALLRSQLEAEAGERGFIITGDPSFLAPYTTGIAAIQDSLARLQTALPDTPDNRATMQTIFRLSAAERADMARAVAAQRSGGFAAAQAVVEAGIGEDDLARIRLIDTQIGQTYHASTSQEAQASAAPAGPLRCCSPSAFA